MISPERFSERVARAGFERQALSQPRIYTGNTVGRLDFADAKLKGLQVYS
jgi:hypothetical protein